MTVTGRADGSRATGAADELCTTGVDEGPQQRPRRADGHADGGPRPRKDEPVGTGSEEEDEPVATDADGLWRAAPAADLARSRMRTAAMGGGAAGSATADAMAGRGEPRRLPDRRRRRTTARDDGGGRPQRADLREDEGDDGYAALYCCWDSTGKENGFGA